MTSGKTSYSQGDAPEGVRSAQLRGRRSFNLRRARTYTHFVTLMKMLLPGLALALIAAIVIYSALYERAGERMMIKFKDVLQVGDEEVRMLNPRFTGNDAKGQPYVVTASSALQDKKNPDLLKLNDIEADITLTDQAWVSMMAPSGALNVRTSILVIDDVIDFYTDSGYEFHAQNGKADLSAGLFESNSAVRGQGPAGKIAANNMRFNIKERRLYFGGGVRMTLYPGPAAKSSRGH